MSEKQAFVVMPFSATNSLLRVAVDRHLRDAISNQRWKTAGTVASGRSPWSATWQVLSWSNSATPK